MRSLTLKLTLAFLFVSMIGVALVALLVSLRTQSEFDQFVLESYQIDLMEDIAQYYQQNKSWADIETIAVRSPYRGFRGGRGLIPAPLTLTDEEGTVIYGGPGNTSGEIIPDDELEHAVPVEVDGDTVGWVLFTQFGGGQSAPPESPESKFLENLNQAVILSVFVALLVATLLGVLLARTISRPVREVTAATQIVAGGDLGYQVPVRTKDEIGELAASFNQMSADLDQANEQRRQMTADIAHDLRTPLSVILGYMEALSAGKLEPTPETFEVMYAKGQHLRHLIDDLRILALADSGELTLTRRLVQPATLLEHSALAHAVEARERGIDLHVEASDDLPEFKVDPDRMTQVLGNLVSNSLRYTPEGGEIALTAARDNQDIVLVVRDSGSGIAPDDVTQIFDRFYRSDRSRQQNGESGLGLAIAKSIVQAHGGTISAASTLGKGTTFSIRMPLDQAG